MKEVHSYCIETQADKIIPRVSGRRGGLVLIREKKIFIVTFALVTTNPFQSMIPAEGRG